MFCETSSFYCTVHKMCFFSLCSFLLPMVFPFTTGVSVHVLRTMFVPGWGGPFELINFMSFLCFLSADTHLPVILAQIFFSQPTRSLFSFPSYSPPHLLIFTLFLDVFSAYIPSSSSLVLASKVPWEPCGLSAGRHTNTTAATTGTSLFSPSLARSLFLSLPFIFFFLHLFLMWKF